MYIKIIDIQNYHGIERLHAEFQKGINLIIGNNGAGKTSLLNALTVALSEPMIFIQGLTPTQITNIDAFQTTLSIGENVFQTENHYPIVVESTLHRPVWYMAENRYIRTIQHISLHSVKKEKRLPR